MAKGDDAVLRKKNKAVRKKQQKDSSSNVSARVAAIIAAKKRRQTGKRRQCQGMCYSLPTPDDPFNDRHGKENLKNKKSSENKKMNSSSQVDQTVPTEGKAVDSSKRNLSDSNSMMGNKRNLNDSNSEMNNNKKIRDMSRDVEESFNSGMEIQLKEDGLNDDKKQEQEDSDCPSKFLILCLNAIEKGLQQQTICGNEENQRLFSNSWGVEFLKWYSNGNNILETNGSSSSLEQIAWMVSIAADAISRKERKQISVSSPFLLFLVPSQEKATKVRVVCKHLKALGIHTVSLHPGANLDHQINGLQSCEPEFLVSTPQRLLELLSSKAIDISRVSFLIVDGVGSFHKDGVLNALTSIRQLISGNPYTVVFDDSHACIPALKHFLPGSIHRLSFNNSIPSQSACIIQEIDMCTSEEEKFVKVVQVLDHAYYNQLHSKPMKVLCVVGDDAKFHGLVKLLKLHDYSISTASKCDHSDVIVQDRHGKKRTISVINAEHIKTIDLAFFELVILQSFVSLIDDYVEILVKMARHTIHGVLHSFFTKEDASLARPLIEILEQCGQVVPEALRNLNKASHGRAVRLNFSHDDFTLSGAKGIFSRS